MVLSKGKPCACVVKCDIAGVACVVVFMLFTYSINPVAHAHTHTIIRVWGCLCSSGQDGLIDWIPSRSLDTQLAAVTLHGLGYKYIMINT